MWARRRACTKEERERRKETDAGRTMGEGVGGMGWDGRDRFPRGWPLLSPIWRDLAGVAVFQERVQYSEGWRNAG